MEIFILLLILGLVFGKMAEGRHFRGIEEREAAHAAVPVTTLRAPPPGARVESVRLATGSVVVAVDYFKMFLSGWRMFFGGEMKSYTTLLERARREAVLRMRESAPGADMFINLRFETADIGGKAKGAPNVEMLAYATALKFHPAGEKG
ncbi:MAG TPA: hypothetical protein DIT64_13990 [Verrucomicrobiales bacterium]|nr:hypothetical protein [Verrucomicrobiales bacterium]